MMRIMIDPGHGGKDPGACGRNRTEKEVVVDVARALRNLLEEAGHTVLLSRNADVFVPLSSRTCRANEWPADLFISLHCNGAEDSRAHGFEVWTSRGETRADALAEKILETWKFRFPSVKLRQDWSDGDGDKEGQFWVLRKTTMPAVLVELGFITHPGFERLTEDPKMTDAWAQALAEAVEGWANG